MLYSKARPGSGLGPGPGHDGGGGGWWPVEGIQTA